MSNTFIIGDRVRVAKAYYKDYNVYISGIILEFLNHKGDKLDPLNYHMARTTRIDWRMKNEGNSIENWYIFVLELLNPFDPNLICKKLK